MTSTPQYEPFLTGDDVLHPCSSHPWSTETWWFSFFAPERGLGGWLYALVRPNQSTSAGGAWIWDSSGDQPRDARYYAYYTNLPTRMERLHAPRLEFPSGFTVEVERPGLDYRLSFDDEAAGLSLDLRFEATTPAIGHKETVPPFEESAHYDQPGHVTGTLLLDGETVPIDCFALRDRSWGLRSERVVPNFSYCWAATAEEAFLAYATRVDGPLLINRGILYRDGVSRPIVSGLRVEERDPDSHTLRAVTINAVDDEGRSIEAEGRAVSHLVHPRATSSNTISVLRWTQDGRQAWGEDQDVWPHLTWRRQFRRGAAAV